MEETRRCQECETVIQGRSDKRFCSDYCRNTFHNRVNRDANHIRDQIHQKLRKNRRVLKELLCDKVRRIISREKLLYHGFYMGYITEITNTRNEKKLYSVYEYGYRFIEKDRVLLIRKTLVN